MENIFSLFLIVFLHLSLMCHDMVVLYFHLPYFHVSNNLLLQSTLVPSFCIDVVLTLSIYLWKYFLQMSSGDMTIRSLQISSNSWLIWKLFLWADYNFDDNITPLEIIITGGWDLIKSCRTEVLKRNEIANWQNTICWRMSLSDIAFLGGTRNETHSVA